MFPPSEPEKPNLLLSHPNVRPFRSIPFSIEGKDYDMPWYEIREPTDQEIYQWVKDQQPKSGFFPQAKQRIGETVKGGLKMLNDIAEPVSIKGVPLALPAPIQAAVNLAPGVVENVQKGVHEVKKAWLDPTFNSRPGVKAAEVGGRAAALPLDAIGYPVTQTADDIVKGNYGGAAVNSVLMGAGTAKGKRAAQRAAKAPLTELELIDQAMDATNAAAEEAYWNRGYKRPTMGDLGRQFQKNPIGTTLGTSKALTASHDLSFPFRQGIFVVDRPEFWKSFKPMIESFRNEHNYQEFRRQIIKDEAFVDARSHGLSLTDVADPKKKGKGKGSRRVEREEQFPIESAEAIFGVRASGRAYSAFGNNVRLQMYKNLLASAEKAGYLTDSAFKRELTKYINTATGRGSLDFSNINPSWNFEGATPFLNEALFSPKLMSSRLRMILKPAQSIGEYGLAGAEKVVGKEFPWYTKQPEFIRRQYLRSALGAAAFTTGVNGLAYLAGKGLGKDTSVELDPTSSDFAKTKIGKTRIEPSGGSSLYLRLAAQGYNKSRKSSITGKTSQLNTGKYGSDNFLDVVTKFIQQKAAPGASLTMDWFRGEDLGGQKFDPLKVSFDNPILQRMYPMIYQDLIKLAKEEPELLPLMVPAAFGIGVQTYEENPFGKAKRSPHSTPRRR